MKRTTLFLTGLMGLILLSGCSDLPAVATATSAPTVPVQTIIVTQIVTVVVTVAPAPSLVLPTVVPATAEVLPTVAPIPTAASIAAVAPTATRVPIAAPTSVPMGNGPVAGNGSTCPTGYPVKGNKGSGIYHVPGQQFYAVTNAQNCFADAASAAAAGYRASKV